jgi:glycosyltransferase involved in cell wall biosynthesis
MTAGGDSARAAAASSTVLVGSSLSPRISVVLPTYNRAQFLDDAFESLCRQTCGDWELIVVDDGSTDDTAAVVERWRPRLGHRFAYVRQDNRGAYGARNSGLDRAGGDFVAFFDSDDLWLPEHLERCLAAFSAVPDLDWVYAACRQVDTTGQVIQATTFEVNGRPQPFLSVPAIVTDGVHVLDPRDALVSQLRHGLYCGLQNSMIRRHVFEGQRFWEDYRVVEDVLFLIRALARGLRIGYRTDVQVIYRVHEGNSSASAAGVGLESLRRICLESVQGLERIRADVPLAPRAMRELRQYLGRQYFWRLGYACYWQAGDAAGALQAMRAGRRLVPWNLAMLKTYVASLVRSRLRKTVSLR